MTPRWYHPTVVVTRSSRTDGFSPRLSLKAVRPSLTRSSAVASRPAQTTGATRAEERRIVLRHDPLHLRRCPAGLAARETPWRCGPQHGAIPSHTRQADFGPNILIDFCSEEVP